MKNKNNDEVRPEAALGTAEGILPSVGYDSILGDFPTLSMTEITKILEDEAVRAREELQSVMHRSTAELCLKEFTQIKADVSLFVDPQNISPKLNRGELFANFVDRSINEIDWGKVERVAGADQKDAWVAVVEAAQKEFKASSPGKDDSGLVDKSFMLGVQFGMLSSILGSGVFGLISDELAAQAKAVDGISQKRVRSKSASDSAKNRAAWGKDVREMIRKHKPLLASNKRNTDIARILFSEAEKIKIEKQGSGWVDMHQGVDTLKRFIAEVRKEL